MNKYNAKDYLPLVQALADGKVIQEWCNANQKWHDALEADFAIPSTMYRIKPEPREIWLVRNENGGIANALYSTREGAADGLRPGWTPVLFREVIE